MLFEGYILESEMGIDGLRDELADSFPVYAYASPSARRRPDASFISNSLHVL